MPEPLRIGFAGTPDFAATILAALLRRNYRPELVLTQPDRPTGRGRRLKPSPVKQLALEHHLAVQSPASLKGYPLPDAALDLLIVAAYGLILPAPILEAPRLGCLNIHASLLPRWRGAAPVERAIMAGDSRTGICLMKMDRGLDTGPLYRCEPLDIGAEETGGMLEARLADLGARLLVATLPQLETLTPQPQPAQGVTYAEKLSAADSVVDWQARSDEIARRIRALADRQPVTVHIDAPTPARVRLLSARAMAAPDSSADPGTILRIDKSGLWVASSDGILCIARLQLNRGKGQPMTAKAAANGYPALLAPGQRLLPSPPAAAAGSPGGS